MRVSPSNINFMPLIEQLINTRAKPSILPSTWVRHNLLRVFSLSKALSLDFVRSLQSLSSIKNLTDFLQRHAAGFGESEVDDDEPQGQSADKHYIVFPTYGIQRYRINKAVEDATAVLRQVEDCETFGAERIR
jgi:hypothetical protein